VSRVMLGGHLYDAATLNEVGTGNRQRMPYWFEGANGAGGTGTRMTTGHGYGDADQD